jgi:hypothetical protein
VNPFHTLRGAPDLTILVVAGNVQVVRDEQGEPCFVTKDLDDTLGYQTNNIPDLRSHVPEEWKGVNRIDSHEVVEGAIPF